MYARGKRKYLRFRQYFATELKMKMKLNSQRNVIQDSLINMVFSGIIIVCDRYTRGVVSKPSATAMIF